MTVTSASPGAVSRPSAVRTLLARTASRHPEWWIVAIALGAWGAVIVPHLWPDQPLAGAVHDHAQHHMPTAALSWGESYLHAGTAWVVMVLAMMLLVAVPRVRFVAAVCPGRIRTRAIAQTVAGVLLVWIALGLLTSVIPIVVPAVTAGDAPWAFIAIWLHRGGVAADPVEVDGVAALPRRARAASRRRWTGASADGRPARRVVRGLLRTGDGGDGPHRAPAAADDRPHDRAGRRARRDPTACAAIRLVAVATSVIGLATVGAAALGA